MVRVGDRHLHLAAADVDSWAALRLPSNGNCSSPKKINEKMGMGDGVRAGNGSGAAGGGRRVDV